MLSRRLPSKEGKSSFTRKRRARRPSVLSMMRVASMSQRAVTASPWYAATRIRSVSTTPLAVYRCTADARKRSQGETAAVPRASNSSIQTSLLLARQLNDKLIIAATYLYEQSFCSIRVTVRPRPPESPRQQRFQPRGTSSISTVSILSPGSGSRCGSRSRMAFTTSMPSTTSPKTACRSSSQGVATWVMKNCELPVYFVRDAIAGAAGPGSGRVAALGHEVLYDPVKGRPVEIALARQKDEIVHRLRSFVGEELYADLAFLRPKGRVVVVVGGEGILGRVAVASLGHLSS